MIEAMDLLIIEQWVCSFPSNEIINHEILWLDVTILTVRWF